MKKYIYILTILSLSGLHLKAQHGIVTTTSSCDEDYTGTIHIVLTHPAGTLNTTYGPPYNVEYYNTTIGGGFYHTSYVKEFTKEGVAPGEYEIRVSLSSTTDLVLCAIVDRTVDVQIQDITSGCADNGGSIEIGVTGGSPPYSYRWSNGSDEQDIEDAAPGEYSITVTDAMGCEGVETATIPDRLSEIEYSMEHNCTPEGESGRVVVHTTEGYTYTWQSNEGVTLSFAGYEIKSNLPVGQVCLTVTDDATLCTQEHCFYIDHEEEIKICCLESKDPCVSTPDGEVEFDVYTKLDYGNAFVIPYISWSDGVEHRGLKKREELAAGTYTATVSTNCHTRVLPFELEYDCECPDFKEVEIAMLWACSPTGDEGSAIVTSPYYPIGGFLGLPRYVSYSWEGDHPVNQFRLDGRHAVNLRQGNYSVTVTDLISGCETSEDFSIGLESPIRLSRQDVTASCPLDGTGTIDFNYYGGTKNYNSNYPNTVIWTDLPGSHPDQGDFYRNNLLPGEYCVLVRSNCYEEEFCFDVPAIEISADFTPTYARAGCESHELSVSASGTNPPFTYLWNNGSEESRLRGIPYGRYTVTVTDASRCTAEITHDLFPITIIEEINACPGLEDGSITIRIDNPSQYPTTVEIQYGNPTLDGGPYLYPVAINNTSNPLDIELNKLRGEVEYIISVTQVLPNGENCSFSYSFQIGEDDYDKKFVRADPLDEEGYSYDCIYDIRCKGATIREGLHEISRYISNDPCERFDQNGGLDNFWNSFTSSLDCGSVNILCGDELVNTIEIDNVKARGGEYRQLIMDMYNYDPFEDFNSNGADPCRRMVYCPQDPENCFAYGWGGNLGGGNFQGYEGPDENGCVKVKCKTFGIGFHSYKICGIDYVPDFLVNYIATNNRFGFNINFSDTLDNRSCNEVENNARQLWENDEQLLEEFGEAYENSELREFIMSMQPNSQFGGVDQINCVQVRYCTNDFSINWHNADEVGCDEIDQELLEEVGNYNFGWTGPCDGTVGFENGTPGLWILCEDSECESAIALGRPCLRPRFVSTLYSDLNFKCESGPTHTQYITKQEDNTGFHSFSLLQDSYGNIYTNGIYRSLDQTYYHYIREEQYNLTKSTHMLHAYEYPEGDYSFYVLRDSMIAEAVTILTGNPDDFQEQSVRATDSLWVEKFTRHSDESYSIKASFQGDFMYNSDVISSAASRSQVLMHIDNYGQLIDHTVVETDADGFSDILNSGADNLLYNITHSSQTISINNAPHRGWSSGSIVEVSTKNGVPIVESHLALTGDLALKAYTSEKSGVDKYYVVTGSSGGIVFKNRNIQNVRNESSYILKVRGDDLDWITEIDVKSIHEFVPNIEVDEDDNIYVGMNTLSDYTNGTQTRGKGGIDITIWVVDANGTFVRDYFYSSESNEILVDIHITNNVLFLGGTISGNAEQRTIGELRYYDFSGGQRHGFTSFVYLDSSDNFEGKGCDEVCDTDVLFDFDNCEVSYSLIGTYADDYFLTIQLPSGQKTEIGYRSEDAYTFNYFTEIGEYKFIFESTNMLCDDITHTVVITEDCVDSGGICNSINNSANGEEDWSGSYISDGSGILSIYFNSIQVPDQLMIYKNTSLIFDSHPYSTYFNQVQVNNSYPNCGAIGGDGPLLHEVELSEGDVIDLYITADNCEEGNTRWLLDAICSANSMSQELESRHRYDVNIEEEIDSEDKEFKDFKYYPNPTNNMVWLSMPFECDYTVSLYTIYNMELDTWQFDGKETNLSLSKFEAGVYFISVYCGESIVTKRIVLVD